MFNEFFRKNRVMSYLYVILRVYLGWEFFQAGYEKLSGGKFDASGFLKGATMNPVKGPMGGIVYPTWNSFLTHFALPHAGLFNAIIPWGELLVGLGLILGCLTIPAVFFGMVMNFSYMFSGTVSTNPEDVLIGMFIIVSGRNAGKWGLDYWVVPFLHSKLCKKATPAVAEATPSVEPPIEPPKEE